MTGKEGKASWLFHIGPVDCGSYLLETSLCRLRLSACDRDGGIHNRKTLLWLFTESALPPSTGKRGLITVPPALKPRCLCLLLLGIICFP